VEIRKNYSRDQLAVIGISGASSGIHSARFIKMPSLVIKPVAYFFHIMQSQCVCLSTSSSQLQSRVNF
ncbi:MAG: hypothetical protein ACPGF8_02640, partial [Opitutales bacterium]